MPIQRQTLSSLLTAVSILFAVLGIATLLPFHTLMVSDLGYRTLCPFAPYSTLTLLFVAWMARVVRQHMNAQPAK